MFDVRFLLFLDTPDLIWYIGLPERDPRLQRLCRLLDHILAHLLLYREKSPLHSRKVDVVEVTSVLLSELTRSFV